MSSRPREGVLERESGIPNSKCLDPLVVFISTPTLGAAENLTAEIRRGTCGSHWFCPSAISSVPSRHMVGLQFFAPLKPSVTI